MSLPDLVGLVGVVAILVAYAGGALGRLDPARAPSLWLNLLGAALILFSLAYDFNLSAVVMEAAWALVAMAGLIRIALRRRP